MHQRRGFVGIFHVLIHTHIRLFWNNRFGSQPVIYVTQSNKRLETRSSLRSDLYATSTQCFDNRFLHSQWLYGIIIKEYSPWKDMNFCILNKVFTRDSESKEYLFTLITTILYGKESVLQTDVTFKSQLYIVQ